MPKGIYARISAEERFWSKVEKRGPDECWPWRGSKISHGYGVFSIKTAEGHKNKFAHRLCWEFVFGPIPFGKGFHGTCVCHSCDRRDCVNPNHLWLGSQADNGRDMAMKGRAAHNPQPGEKCGRHILTECQVLEIRRNDEGLSGPAWARRFGVGNSTIYSVRHGRSWTHLIHERQQ